MPVAWKLRERKKEIWVQVMNSVVFPDIGLSKITKGESIEGREAGSKPIHEKFALRFWLWGDDRGGVSKKQQPEILE